MTCAHSNTQNRKGIIIFFEESFGKDFEEQSCQILHVFDEDCSDGTSEIRNNCDDSYD